MELNIICAHVHHGIRGAEADSDELFVKNYCQDNNILFKSVHYNVPEISAKTGESVEMCGRRLRYQFFNSLAPNAKIATAHNADDCIETFLLNLARGTSIKGLCGIPAVRGNIIRPLIDCTRSEIEEYLSFNGVVFVTDSTNLSEDYTRNKIRHKIVPVLKSINPEFSAAFKNCSENIAMTNEYVHLKAQSLLDSAKSGEKFSVNALLKAEKLICTETLIKICEYFGVRDISHAHISLLYDALSGGAVVMTGNIQIVSDGDYIFKGEKPLPEREIFKQINKLDEVYEFEFAKIELTTVDKSALNNYNTKKLSVLGYADADKIKNCVFRTRLAGDRFRYPFAEHSKALKNLFKEKNITKALRHGVPFIANSENVLWIDGIGVSHYACVDENTKNVVHISVKKG